MVHVTLDAAFYDLTQNAQGALVQGALEARRRAAPEEESAPPPVPPIMQLRAGYAEAPRWMLVQAAEFDPEPLTVQNVRVRAVWSAPGLIRALLELLASEGWLDRVDEAYYLTDAGREVNRKRFAAIHDLLADYVPLDIKATERLESLLWRVLDASLQSPTPPGTWCLAHSRRRAPASDAPLAVRIFHYCADLNAVRDDAHMAAFAPYEVDAYAWEALAFIAQGTPGTPDALFSKLNYRGYSRQDYAKALDSLTARGWLRDTGEGRAITDGGQAARAEAERLTDQYFYAPWSCLSSAEIEELHTLLTRIVGSSQT